MDMAKFIKTLVGKFLCERGKHHLVWAGDDFEVEAPNGKIWYRDRYKCIRPNCTYVGYGEIVASRQG